VLAKVDSLAFLARIPTVFIQATGIWAGLGRSALMGLKGLNSDFVNGELAVCGFTNEGSNLEKVEG